MNKVRNDADLPNQQTDNETKIVFPGYPLYPDNEDIYIKDQIDVDVDPENIAEIKTPNGNNIDSNNEKGFDDDLSGTDLDIPGSEMDDEQENIGSEDEENNYYSLGGDAHNDLEEDQGE